MSIYKHQKGVIQDNAIHALLHDPLFRQRTEKNLKGKGSYRRKDKNGKGNYQEDSAKCSYEFLALSFALKSHRKMSFNAHEFSI